MLLLDKMSAFEWQEVCMHVCMHDKRVIQGVLHVQGM